jgi:hypothetical protein
LLFFDESSFIPKPPIAHLWSPRGQRWAIEPKCHRKCVNVLIALDQSQGRRRYAIVRPTQQADVGTFSIE